MVWACVTEAANSSKPSPRIANTEAAHSAGHYRLLLPQALSHGEAEAFLERFLHNNGGSPLQRVDLQCRPRRQIENDHVRIVPGGLHYFLQDNCAFRIVGSAATRQN